MFKETGDWLGFAYQAAGITLAFWIAFNSSDEI